MKMAHTAAMKMAARFVLASLLLGSCQAAASDGHPIEKVIGLLTSLIEKTEFEGKAEAVTYEKFEYWCANSATSLRTAIADGKETIDELESKIKSKMEEEELLTEQIAALDAELLKLQAADKAASDGRSSQAALYASADADYTATISAISQAITELETAESSQSKLLLAQRRVQQALVLAGAAATEEQRSMLKAFVQQDATSPTARPVLKAEGDYAKHVEKYAFKSQKVIELLKDLKLKFEDEKLASTKAETDAINAFELAKAARQDLTNAATASRGTKSTELGSAKDDRIQAQGSLATEESELSADEATLAQTEKTCMVKKSEWAERSETRTKELEAMKAAIEILSKATGVRTEAPTNPVPPPSPAALLQLTSDPKLQAVQLLRTAARDAHSHALERLAQEISMHLAGPFDAVNNMIQKMVFHLMDEQKDEDKHKYWCDLELNKTEISKADKEDKMAALKAKLDAATATVQTLSAEIKAADGMVQTIAEHMDEAAKIRQAGKAENKEAMKDAQDAQAALSSAIAVLEAFYKDSGMVKKEAWELLQRAPVTLPAEPATWGSSYTGVADPTNQPAGIIAVLKKVSADFASMEAQTLAQEESDQKIFEEDMKLCDIAKARHAKASEVKGQEKRRLVDKIASMTATRKHVSDEKEAVEQYLKDLQHACVDGDSTYEDRKAARTKEIDALKQAQTILATAFEDKNQTSPPSFLQRRSLRRAL
uniref:Uncharacterized protein n=1 Tax=Alexandrium monilatum TaxID=311494 RepID=A0A7S4QW52_9DINO